jgi:hypothetical protein
LNVDFFPFDPIGDEKPQSHPRLFGVRVHWTLQDAVGHIGAGARNVLQALPWLDSGTEKTQEPMNMP